MKWMITKFIAIIILWCKSNHYSVYFIGLSADYLLIKWVKKVALARVAIEWLSELQIMATTSNSIPRESHSCFLTPHEALQDQQVYVTLLFSCCSVAKLCLTLCDPNNCSTPGFPWPSLSLRVCSNSCHCLSQWCYHPSHPLLSFSLPSSFQTTASVLELWICEILCTSFNRECLFPIAL